MNRRKSKARIKVPTLPAVPVPIPNNGRLFWLCMLYRCDQGEFIADRYPGERQAPGQRQGDDWSSPYRSSPGVVRQVTR